MNFRLSRRRFLTVTLSAAATAALGIYFLTSNRSGKGSERRSVRDLLASLGRSDLNPRYLAFLEWLAEVSPPIAGSRTYVALMAESTGLALQRIERDFYYASGVDSKLDVSPYPVHVTKTLSALSVGTAIHDLVAVESFDLALYRPYLTEVGGLPERYKDYTYDGFRLDDFIGPSLELVCYYPPVGPRENRVPVLLPLSAPTMIRFYRADLYERLGRPPGRTWDEHLEDLRDLHNPTGGTFATAMQLGSDVGAVTEFNNLVFSYGGRLFEVGEREVVPVMDSSEVVEALEVYSRMRPFADPASISYDWDAVANAMRRGRIATAILWQDFAWMMDDPERSTVVGKVRYLRNPAGPSGSFHQFVGDGLGLTRNSRNRLAAWLWLQWATEVGTRIELMLDKRSLSIPVRRSAFDDDSVKANIGRREYESVKVVKEVLDSGEVAYVPPTIKANQVMFVLARHIRSAWAGRDPRTVAKEMKEEVEALGPFTY
ncbi:MAG: extracellular solute-binding protein [Aigarchaeota archaeon]|nr:extracellular solute-binding protein [Candidatus Calditenuis fumarioli]